MRKLTPLLLLAACGSPDSSTCDLDPTALTWQINTNTRVANTRLGVDSCNRYTQAVADLLPGGSVTMSSAVRVPTGYASAYVVIDSGVDVPCAAVAVALDSAAHQGLVSSFATHEGSHTARITARAEQFCSIGIRPRVKIGGTP